MTTKKINYKKHKIIFNYVLLVCLLLALTWTMISIRNFQKAGIVCQNNPFLFGARKFASAQDNGHMYCSCSIYGDEYMKPYSFSEMEENPRARIKDLIYFNITNSTE